MIEHDLDITRNREQLKSIRRGEWDMQRITDWFETKEKALERTYEESTLQYEPDEKAISTLLLDCLEHHYGSLSNAVARRTDVDDLVKDMKALIEKYER